MTNILFNLFFGIVAYVFFVVFIVGTNEEKPVDQIPESLKSSVIKNPYEKWCSFGLVKYKDGNGFWVYDKNENSLVKCSSKSGKDNEPIN